MEVVTLEIDAKNAPAVYTGKGLDRYFDHIKASVNEVPDVSTAKGRTRIASLAAQVSRSKVAVEQPGREYLKFLKEQVKPVEAELREFVGNCDALRDEVRKPLTDWEAEQSRIEAERKAAEEAAALALKVGHDHEVALLMNAEFDRQRADALRKADEERIERERKIAEESAARARQEEQDKAKAEQEAAQRREIEAKLAQERAEREKAEAEQRARDAEERAEQERKDSAEREENARKQAIADEKRKQEAEAKRIEDERLAREADKKHKGAINSAALDDFIAAGLSADDAKLAVIAIACKKVRHVAISY